MTAGHKGDQSVCLYSSSDRKIQKQTKYCNLSGLLLICLKISHNIGIET